MNEEFLKALREQDANLRDAIRQDEMERPQMPADLNARLMQRMSQQPQKSRIRRLWPWLAAACVTAFIIVLVAPPKEAPAGEPQVTAKVEQPATTEPQRSEPQAEAPCEAQTQKAIEAPAKSPRQVHKAVAAQPVAAEPLLAQTPAPAETALPAVEETDLTATAVAQTSSQAMTTLTERDIPITRPENYEYTPEELALLKKQANEAYLKWVELELEISKCNLEQTAQK